MATIHKNKQYIFICPDELRKRIERCRKYVGGPTFSKFVRDAALDKVIRIEAEHGLLQDEIEPETTKIDNGITYLD